MTNSEILRPLLCGFVCAGGAFIIAIGVIALLVVNQRKSRKKYVIPDNWRSAQGRIIATQVEEAARTKVDDDEFYMPMVEFEYTVEGQVYTSKQAVGRPYNVTFKAKQTLEHYPIGGNITVHYNPEKVDQARLMIS
jgi:hypothetical protein